MTIGTENVCDPQNLSLHIDEVDSVRGFSFVCRLDTPTSVGTVSQLIVVEEHLFIVGKQLSCPTSCSLAYSWQHRHGQQGQVMPASIFMTISGRELIGFDVNTLSISSLSRPPSLPPATRTVSLR